MPTHLIRRHLVASPLTHRVKHKISNSKTFSIKIIYLKKYFYASIIFIFAQLDKPSNKNLQADKTGSVQTPSSLPSTLTTGATVTPDVLRQLSVANTLTTTVSP